MTDDTTEGKLLVLPGGGTPEPEPGVRVEAGIGKVLVIVEGPAARRAQALAEQADAFESIDASNFEVAGAVVAELAGIAKRLELDRAHIKAPVLALGRAIDKAARDFVTPLEAAKDRLAAKVAAHIRDVKAQKEAALAERRAAMAEPPTWPGPPTGRAPTIPLAPIPVVPKSPVSPRKVPVLVITDPSLVPIEVAGAVIRPIDEAKLKALLRAGVVVPGAHLEEDDGVTVRSR